MDYVKISEGIPDTRVHDDKLVLSQQRRRVSCSEKLTSHGRINRGKHHDGMSTFSLSIQYGACPHLPSYIRETMFKKQLPHTLSFSAVGKTQTQLREIS